MTRTRPWLATAAVCAVVSAASALGAWRLDRVATPSSAAAPVSAADQPVSQTPLFTLPEVGWQATWTEEFTRPSQRWKALTGGNGWSHRALQYYSPAGARLDGDGRLVLTATRLPTKTDLRCWYGSCHYQSARVQTLGRFSQAYGRFAARIKLPVGRGIWPSFWLQRVNGGLSTSPTYGEIDVVETRGEEQLVHSYTHARGHKGGGVLLLDEPLHSGFHTYGVDWTPEAITWWVDGKPYAQQLRYDRWPFTRPFFLVLSLQVGGSWAGPPRRATVFPARMVVDWVRVYRAV